YETGDGNGGCSITRPPTTAFLSTSRPAAPLLNHLHAYLSLLRFATRCWWLSLSLTFSIVFISRRIGERVTTASYPPPPRCVSTAVPIPRTSPGAATARRRTAHVRGHCGLP